MERDPALIIIEYKNNEVIRSWDGMADCAKYHHISTKTLKWLLANGAPLYKDPSISFDLDPDCPFSYVIQDDNPVLVMDAMRAIRDEPEA